MKTNAVTMFGYDISDHEALKEGIVHPGPDPSAFGIIPMLAVVSEIMLNRVTFEAKFLPAYYLETAPRNQ